MEAPAKWLSGIAGPWILEYGPWKWMGGVRSSVRWKAVVPIANRRGKDFPNRCATTDWHVTQLLFLFFFFFFCFYLIKNLSMALMAEAS